MKICPACKASSGPRTKVCSCGRNFSTDLAPVAANPATPMTSDPLNDRLDAGEAIKASLSSTKDIIQKVERRSLSIPEPWDDEPQGNGPALIRQDAKPVASEPVPKLELKEAVRSRGGRSNIFVPTGDCPFKPEGYKSGWPDGPATDEAVQKWAIRVFVSGNYHPNAVVYWARDFWNMNDVSEVNGVKVYGAEWKRIRGLIHNALASESDHEPNSED